MDQRAGGGGGAEGASLVIPARVLVRVVGGEMVLLNLESEQYFGLNRVGAQMVTRLTGQPWADALASLEADFDVDAAVLRRDVEDLTDSLVMAGLLDRVDATP